MSGGGRGGDEAGVGGGVVKVKKNTPVPKFMDPHFCEKKPKYSYSVIENEHFGLVYAKTGSTISGTVLSSAAEPKFF